jgi:hypothetical protein
MRVDGPSIASRLTQTLGAANDKHRAKPDAQDRPGAAPAKDLAAAALRHDRPGHEVHTHLGRHPERREATYRHLAQSDPGLVYHLEQWRAQDKGVAAATDVETKRAQRGRADPAVQEAVDEVLPADASAAQRQRAYQIVQDHVDLVGGLGDDGITLDALPARALTLLQQRGVETRFDPRVIDVVNAELAPNATAQQRYDAYVAVQDYVDRVGGLGDSGITAEALPERVRELLTELRLPLKPPTQHADYRQGARDAEELHTLLDRATTGDKLSDSERARIAELQQSLAKNADNGLYSAGFYARLGPERAAELPALVSSYAQQVDYNEDGELNELDYEQFGRDLSTSLGTASRSGLLADDYAQRLRESSAPSAEAVYLSTGTFDAEFVAEFSADVFNHHDPNLASQDQAFSVPGHSGQEMGGPMFGMEALVLAGTSMDIAIGAVERSDAQSHVLARPGVAERLLDRGFEIHDPSTAAAVARLLDAPRAALAGDPNDPMAIAAGVELYRATVAHEGDIAEHAQAAVAALYVEHTGAILNAGEDEGAAWNADTPFARALANDAGLDAGSAHWFVTAALGAQGNAPGGRPWDQAVIDATAAYRAEVAQAGPGAAGDADRWAREVAETDLEITQAIGRRGVLDGRDLDDRNAGYRWAIDKLTDYLGKIPYGQPFTGYAARGVNLVEDYGLDAILPIDNAAGARDAIPEQLRNQIVATQYAVLDGMIRNGMADGIPPSLLADPNDPSKGLRVPTSAADASRLQAEVQAYVRGLAADDPVRVAIAEATKTFETALADFGIAVLPD